MALKPANKRAKKLIKKIPAVNKGANPDKYFLFVSLYFLKNKQKIKKIPAFFAKL